MEDILAILLIFGGGTCIALAFSPLGKALADRLRHGKLPLPIPEPDPALWEEVDRLRAEIAEIQERLDFSERLLTQGRPAASEEE